MTLDEDAAKVIDELIAHADSVGLHSKPIVLAALQHCAEAMREECAKVCESTANELNEKLLEALADATENDYHRGFLNGGRNELHAIAQAIRRVEVK